MTERKIALSIEEAADYTGIGRNIPTRKRIIPCASPDMQPGTNVYLVGKTSTR